MVIAMEVRVSYGADVAAADIKLAPIGPGNAIKQVVVHAEHSGQIVLDFDREDHLIVIEFLDATRVLPRELLASAVVDGGQSLARDGI